MSEKAQTGNDRPAAGNSSKRSGKQINKQKNTSGKNPGKTVTADSILKPVPEAYKRQTEYSIITEHLNTTAEDIDRRRANHAVRTSELLAKGTKSAKKRLRLITEKYISWQTDINRQVTAALVKLYGKDAPVILEEIRKSAAVYDIYSRISPEYAKYLRSWDFDQLNQMIQDRLSR